ncbi:MAG: putative transporter [Bacteroidales bacterium]|nr:putative transporter [Bacteroidales bacterium]MDY6000855.1 putative transporter [Candidatus Cryptobacteroides sp.]
MDWISGLLVEQNSLQAVVVILLIIAIGLGLGRVKIAGVSLGVTFVFFCGILAGHLGLRINQQMLQFAENFGLIIFVYALGLQVGPGFFNSFRKGGVKLNLWGLAVLFLGTLLTILFSFIAHVSLPDMVGIMCGATTNTPALAAAQQTLEQMGIESSSLAIGTAVTYPLGVVGVIIALIVLAKFLGGKENLQAVGKGEENPVFIATYVVSNPAIFGKTVREVARMSASAFVISRIWRNGTVSIPQSATVLDEGDKLLVVTSEKELEELRIIFGKEEERDWNRGDIDWNAIDSTLVSRVIVITKRHINGKTIGSLKLRNHYDVNISRVFRAGVTLLAEPDLTLQMGDRIVVVGKESDINNLETKFGNAVRNLNEPNLISICIGIIIGLAIGSIPISFPGISAPVRLGIAGGPIIAGILMGSFGPRIHMVTYSTESANLMLRRLGLSMYLACLGLSAGEHFFETVVRPEGLLWIGLGFVITIVPVLLVGWLALKFGHLDLGSVTGMLCGSMANPMALTYANDTIPNDNPAVTYATVYPLSMFVRVLIAQLLLVLFL